MFYIKEENLLNFYKKCTTYNNANFNLKNLNTESFTFSP